MLGQEWPEGWTKWAAKPESTWTEPKKEDRENPSCINSMLLTSQLGQQHSPHKGAWAVWGKCFAGD